MIHVRQKGDLSKTTRYLEKVKSRARWTTLEKYANEGVAALSSATPIDTGLTADSWGYRIERGNGSAKIIFTNSNVNKGVNIAMILQYGHGTRNGGWVEGRDYINPAIQPVFDQIVKTAWREVTSI